MLFIPKINDSLEHINIQRRPLLEDLFSMFNLDVFH